MYIVQIVHLNVRTYTCMYVEMTMTVPVAPEFRFVYYYYWCTRIGVGACKRVIVLVKAQHHYKHFLYLILHIIRYTYYMRIQCAIHLFSLSNSNCSYIHTCMDTHYSHCVMDQNSRMHLGMLKTYTLHVHVLLQYI